jgi:hypothetical protein
MLVTFTRILLAWLAAASAHALGQTVGFWGFTPMTLHSARAPAQVLLEMKITGSVSRVAIEFQPGQTGPVTSLVLRDDGTGGDRIAGDAVYSVLLPTSAVLTALRPDDVQRVFVGFVDVFNGNTRTGRYNIFIDVYTGDLGAPEITRLAANVQATERVVNLATPAYFDEIDRLGGSAQQYQTGLAGVLEEFYNYFSDDYDFINVVFSPARILNRVHISVRNTIAGLGLQPMDIGAQYGSAQRLLGLNFFPIAALFDGADPGYLHELAHQWISYLNFGPFALARPHWPYSSMGGGIMGTTIGGTGGEGGTFACDVQELDSRIVLAQRPDGPKYNDLELYLMGLIGPEQVRTQFVLDDQVGARDLRCVGQVFNGAVTRVTAQDVIRGAGPRVPDVFGSPVNFRIATILVTREGLASPETMWLYSAMAARAEGRTPTAVHAGLVKFKASPFFVATRGLATIDTRVSVREPYVIQGFPVGPLAARSLSISVRPRAEDLGVTRQLFVAALLDGKHWYFRTPSGWQAWADGEMPPFATRQLASDNRMQVLDGTLDLSSLAGTPIYAGYGVDGTEMVASGRYALVHTLH